MIDNIREIASKIEKEIIAIRRTIHENPEESLREFNTSRLILKKLEKLNLDEIQLFEPTGILAILRGKKCNTSNVKTIMLRGDMDALPINEETNLDFKSNNGFMHACGHDAHIAWTLGCAMVLSELRHLFSGTVKFLFQPGEEIGGAVNMVKQGVLNNPKVDAVIAGHCWPNLKSNQIGIASDVAMSSTSTFEINIYGKGGHGAQPHKCIDPIMIGVQVYNAINNIISRGINPVVPTVVSICSFNAGNSANIIPDTCQIQGTIRSTTYDDVIKINKQIENITANICNIYNVDYSFKRSGICLPVNNNQNLINQFINSTSNILGNNLSIFSHPEMTGEDFSEYSTRTKGLFLYIGCNKNENYENRLHSCKFNLDEDIIKNTICLFSKFIIDYLN